MATPHVSGLAGLLFAQGTISNAQVRNRIESTATDLVPAGRDDVFGHGRIDAQAALRITRQTYEETAPEVVYKGSWTRRYAGAAFGGYVNTSTQYDASATFSFRGNSVTWWGFECPSCVGASVYVDGSYAAWVDLYSPTFRARVPAFTKSWPTSGVHTIKIVLANPMWPLESSRADVDAFTVTRPVS